MNKKTFSRGTFTWEIWTDYLGRTARYANSDGIDIDIEHYDGFQIHRLHHENYDVRMVQIADRTLCYRIIKGAM